MVVLKDINKFEALHSLKFELNNLNILMIFSWQQIFNI